MVCGVISNGELDENKVTRMSLMTGKQKLLIWNQNI